MKGFCKEIFSSPYRSIKACQIQVWSRVHIYTIPWCRPWWSPGHTRCPTALPAGPLLYPSLPRECWTQTLSSLWWIPLAAIHLSLIYTQGKKKPHFAQVLSRLFERPSIQSNRCNSWHYRFVVLRKLIWCCQDFILFSVWKQSIKQFREKPAWIWDNGLIHLYILCASKMKLIRLLNYIILTENTRINRNEMHKRLTLDIWAKAGAQNNICNRKRRWRSDATMVTICQKERRH